MRTSVAFIVGALVLAGAGVFRVGGPAFAGTDGGRILLAADESSAAKDTYQSRARQTLDLWQKKITEFGEEAQEKGNGAGKQAGQSLDHAWGDMREKWQALQTVSADGWDQARTAFEKATARMQNAWQRATSKSQ
jgi:hypothetical protein